MRTLFARPAIAGLFLCLALIMNISTSIPVQAQAVCMKRAKLLDRLATEFHEVRQGIGLREGGGVVELYVGTPVAAVPGSFSIVVNLPDGQSCLVLAGQQWKHVVPAKPNPSDSSGLQPSSYQALDTP